MKKYILMILMICLSGISWGQFNIGGGTGTATTNADSIMGEYIDTTLKTDGYALIYDSGTDTYIYQAVAGGTDSSTVYGWMSPIWNIFVDSTTLDTIQYAHKSVASDTSLQASIPLADSSGTSTWGSTTAKGVFQASSDNFAASGGMLTIKDNGINGADEVADSTLTPKQFKAVAPASDSNIAVFDITGDQLEWIAFPSLYNFYYSDTYYDFKGDEINDTMIDFGTGTNQFSATDLPDFGTMTQGVGYMLLSNNTTFSSVEMSDDASISSSGVITVDSATVADSSLQTTIPHSDSSDVVGDSSVTKVKLTYEIDSMYVDTSEVTHPSNNPDSGYVLKAIIIGTDTTYTWTQDDTASASSGDNAYADTNGSGGMSDLGSPFYLRQGTGIDLHEANDSLYIDATLGTSVDLANEVTGTLPDGNVANAITVSPINATTETAIEAAIDLQSLQGAVIDAQVPDTLTITLADGSVTYAKMNTSYRDSLGNLQEAESIVGIG